MTAYLFDTGYLFLVILGNLPEKWYRSWNEVKRNTRKGYTIEPVIAELCYQLLRRGYNKSKVQDEIFRIKSSVILMRIDDNISISAGQYNMRFRSLGLSYTDCYLLAIAKKYSLKLYTTDSDIRKASKMLGIQCDYIPITTD